MEQLIHENVDQLLDNIAELDEIDMLADFGMVLSTEITSVMLGIRDEYRRKLRSYSISILSALDPVVSDQGMQEGNQAVSEFSEVSNDLINHHRIHPGGAQQGEVLESLIFGDHEGRVLTRDELTQNCIFILNAGHETTTSLASKSVGLFFTNSAQHRLLLENPDLIEAAVEECLRSNYREQALFCKLY